MALSTAVGSSYNINSHENALHTCPQISLTEVSFQLRAPSDQSDRWVFNWGPLSPGEFSFYKVEEKLGQTPTHPIYYYFMGPIPLSWLWDLYLYSWPFPILTHFLNFSNNACEVLMNRSLQRSAPWLFCSCLFTGLRFPVDLDTAKLHRFPKHSCCYTC